MIVSWWTHFWAIRFVKRMASPQIWLELVINCPARHFYHVFGFISCILICFRLSVINDECLLLNTYIYLISFVNSNKILTCFCELYLLQNLLLLNFYNNKLIRSFSMQTLCWSVFLYMYVKMLSSSVHLYIVNLKNSCQYFFHWYVDISLNLMNVLSGIA